MRVVKPMIVGNDPANFREELILTMDSSPLRRTAEMAATTTRITPSPFRAFIECQSSHDPSWFVLSNADTCNTLPRGTILQLDGDCDGRAAAEHRRFHRVTNLRGGE